MSPRLRDARGRFTGPQEPNPGPLWIEAPTDPRDWWAPRSCSVVDVRRPNPDPRGEGGKGFEVVFTGTFAECDAWLEAADAPTTSPARDEPNASPRSRADQ